MWAGRDACVGVRWSAVVSGREKRRFRLGARAESEAIRHSDRLLWLAPRGGVFFWARQSKVLIPSAIRVFWAGARFGCFRDFRRMRCGCCDWARETAVVNGRATRLFCVGSGDRRRCLGARIGGCGPSRFLFGRAKMGRRFHLPIGGFCWARGSAFAIPAARRFFWRAYMRWRFPPRSGGCALFRRPPGKELIFPFTGPCGV